MYDIAKSLQVNVFTYCTKTVRDTLQLCELQISTGINFAVLNQVAHYYFMLNKLMF